MIAPLCCVLNSITVYHENRPCQAENGKRGDKSFRQIASHRFYSGSPRNPCTPCNPRKICNPCKPYNPCKPHNPCNSCNSSNTCNPYNPCNSRNPYKSCNPRNPRSQYNSCNPHALRIQRIPQSPHQTTKAIRQSSRFPPSTSSLNRPDRFLRFSRLKHLPRFDRH